VENDTSEKVTIENPILSNIDDEFPTIDIISPLKSPVKSAAVAQDVDKSTVYYLSFFPLFCKFYMFILISYLIYLNLV
jgi:hypothetical protein